MRGLARRAFLGHDMGMSVIKFWDDVSTWAQRVHLLWAAGRCNELLGNKNFENLDMETKLQLIANWEIQ